MNVNPQQQLHKKSDVAKMLGVSMRTVSTLIKHGLPIVKFSPRCYRYDLDQVRQWAKEKYGTFDLSEK